MLAGEKINLYLERIETLIGEISSLREATLSEHNTCVNNNSIDSEYYAPSDTLKAQVANLYCMVRLKSELLNRVSNFLSIWKMDPQHKPEDIEEINVILRDFATESENDMSFVREIKDMSNFSGDIKVVIYDNDGVALETIELSGDF